IIVVIVGVVSVVVSVVFRLGALFFVVVIVGVLAVKFERVGRRETEVAGATFADPRVSNFHFFQIVFVDFDFDVTFRAGRHTLSSD
ncbi:MAG: hypothetical protein HQ485_09420, partial [Acidobacteria bacterium]|nr:hypothetical protein [Acidobacteriota bacterium]